MNQTEETKVAVMQEQIKNLDSNMEKVMDNHLPHIYEELKSLREEISGLKISLARYIGIGVGAIAVIEIALKFIGK